MKPFVRDLYAEIAGRSKRGFVTLGEHARRCIRLWRCSLVALELKRSEFNRPIATMREKRVEYVIEYDASLRGVGLVLFSIEDGVETMMKAAKVALPYDLGSNAGFQNTVEFIAVVMGLGCLASLGVKDAAIGIRGDNTSSLSWSLHHRFSDGYSRRATVAYIALAEGLGLRVDEGEHIAGVNNTTCDGLSRDVSLEELGFIGDRVLRWEEDPRLVSLMLSCSPLPVVESDEEIARLWSINSVIVKELGEELVDLRRRSPIFERYRS